MSIHSISVHSLPSHFHNYFCIRWISDSGVSVFLIPHSGMEFKIFKDLRSKDQSLSSCHRSHPGCWVFFFLPAYPYIIFTICRGELRGMKARMESFVSISICSPFNPFQFDLRHQVILGNLFLYQNAIKKKDCIASSLTTTNASVPQNQMTITQRTETFINCLHIYNTSWLALLTNWIICYKTWAFMLQQMECRLW